MKINLKPLTDIIHGDQKPKSNTDSNYHLKYLKQHYRNGARVFQVKISYNGDIGDYKAEMPYDFIFENNEDLEAYKPRFVSNPENESNYISTYLVREVILKRTISQFNLEETQIFYSSVEAVGDKYYHLEILLFVERLEDKNEPLLKEMFYTQYVSDLIENFKQLIAQTFETHNQKEFQQKLLSNTHSGLSKLFSDAFEWYQNYNLTRDPDAVNYCTICEGLASFLQYLEHHHPMELQEVEKYDEPFLLGLHNFQRNDEGLVISKWIEWEDQMNKTEVYVELKEPKTVDNVESSGQNVFKLNDFDDIKSYVQRITAVKEGLSLEINQNLDFDIFSFSLLEKYAKALIQVFTSQKNKIISYTPHRTNLVATYFTKAGAKFTGFSFQNIAEAPDYLQDNLHECVGAQYKLLEELLSEMNNVETKIRIEGQKSSGSGSYAPDAPSYYASPHYEDHAYSISLLVAKINEIKDPSKRISYMWEARNEYKYYFGDKHNIWGTNFAEQVEKEIKKVTIIETVKPVEVESKNEIKSEASSIPTFKKLKWNNQINILADIFFQLTNEIQKDGKKVLEAEKQEVVDFLCRNFTDKDGQELSPSSLATMLSTTRVDKRPKEHKRYNVQKQFEEK